MAGVVAPIALGCVMHQSLAVGVEAESERRERELQRLSISARSQMMTFSRAIWLRERGSPGADACLWQLWESDWTAIRRMSVASLPAWCRDMRADVAAEESRDYAITFLHSHAMPQALRDAASTRTSPAFRPDVSMAPAALPGTPLMASPSRAIQMSLDDTPSHTVAPGARARLSQARMFEDRTDSVVAGMIATNEGGLLD